MQSLLKFLQIFFLLSMAKKRGATRFLRPTLCALLVFSSVLLFQCKDDEPAGVEVTITADKTTVTFPAAGGDYAVKITSSGDWNVKEEIAWLETKNVDNTLLKVTCAENTGAERSGKVTATIEEKSIEITVTQQADTQPSFGSETIDDQTYLENSSITDLTLPEAMGGNGDLTYSVTPALPAGLILTGRVLSGTPEEGTAAGSDGLYLHSYRRR